MGLDVHLYRYHDFESSTRRETEYETRSNEVWEKAGKYDDLSTEEKDLVTLKTQEIAKELGLDKWGSDEGGKEGVELDSGLYPDHMFKIGYFRSSYNSGGINSILRSSTQKDLYWIFQPDRDEYHVHPNWLECREKAEIALEEFLNWMQAFPDIGCEEISFLGPSEIDSKEKALEVFGKHFKKEKQQCSFERYSCKEGHFYIDSPLEVLAVLPGTRSLFSSPDPCAYVIYREPGKYEWYKQALEVVVETIDYVLSQPDPENYVLHWSA